ncbi:hypothetical protein BJ508DRAFT_309385 [Ascobolus immersus RN42]|uniref:Uncharacterized protein n=1 Tax=Ascobolus immersus RN42 TaxID=1160509 RepID=A0A3N4I0N3_ASCIM|nr:hypothetical protein BJ508DRAFT_309385 [Ascobolus immersus RN42]
MVNPDVVGCMVTPDSEMEKMSPEDHRAMEAFSERLGGNRVDEFGWNAEILFPSDKTDWEYTWRLPFRQSLFRQSFGCPLGVRFFAEFLDNLRNPEFLREYCHEYLFEVVSTNQIIPGTAMPNQFEPETLPSRRFVEDHLNRWFERKENVSFRNVTTTDVFDIAKGTVPMHHQVVATFLVDFDMRTDDPEANSQRRTEYWTWNLTLMETGNGYHGWQILVALFRLTIVPEGTFEDSDIFSAIRKAGATPATLACLPTAATATTAAVTQQEFEEMPLEVRLCTMRLSCMQVVFDYRGWETWESNPEKAEFLEISELLKSAIESWPEVERQRQNRWKEKHIGLRGDSLNWTADYLYPCPGNWHNHYAYPEINLQRPSVYSTSFGYPISIQFLVEFLGILKNRQTRKKCCNPLGYLMDRVLASPIDPVTGLPTGEMLSEVTRQDFLKNYINRWFRCKEKIAFFPIHTCSSPHAYSTEEIVSTVFEVQFYEKYAAEPKPRKTEYWNWRLVLRKAEPEDLGKGYKGWQISSFEFFLQVQEHLRTSLVEDFMRQYDHGGATPLTLLEGPPAADDPTSTAAAGPEQGGASTAGPTQGGAGAAGPTQGGAGAAGPIQGAAGAAGPTQGEAGAAGPIQGGAGAAGPTQGGAGAAGPTQGGAGAAGPTQSGPAPAANTVTTRPIIYFGDINTRPTYAGEGPPQAEVEPAADTAVAASIIRFFGDMQIGSGSAGA